MSKGALPVPYLVALIIAVVIIGVLVYMFLTHTGIFQGTVSKEYCEALRFKVCFEWQKNNYAGSAPSWDGRCEKIGVSISPDICDGILGPLG